MTKTFSHATAFFSHMKNLPGDMTKTVSDMPRSPDHVTKPSSRPAGNFCHMKKDVLGLKKGVFGANIGPVLVHHGGSALQKLHPTPHS